MVKRLSALACGVILLPLSNAVGAEGFDVLVMHGSTLVRVTGDENGPTSEVTVREDPAPPAPEVAWESTDEPPEPVELVIQIFRDAPRPAYGWGFGHGHPIFTRHDKPHHGSSRAMARGKRNRPGLVRQSSRWSAPGALFNPMKGRSSDARIRRPVALARIAR
jgi:hypothetical protein